MIYSRTNVLDLHQGQTIVTLDNRTGTVKSVSPIVPGGRVWITFTDGSRYPIHHSHHVMATQSDVVL